MRSFFLAVSCLALAAFAGGFPPCPAAAAPEARFFSGLSDVPLMPGLTEIEGGSVLFDKPEGRIVQAAARGQGVGAAAILGFYDAALPQFGWKKSGPGLYIRQDEKLELSVPQQAGQPVLHLTIEPR
jgi:hypothetical protein